MGTIRTTGRVMREVEYDKMTIMMTFNTRDRRSKDAIRKVIEECEQFLAELNKAGVDTSKIRGGRNNVSRNNYIDDKGTDAVRTISWDTDYDQAMIDAVMQLSEKGSYDVDISIEPRYSKVSELCRELMKEAALDARSVADLLAESLGTKVKGPAKINASGDFDYITDEQYMDDCCNGAAKAFRSPDCGVDFSRFSELKKPTATHTQQITIEWELED